MVTKSRLKMALAAEKGIDFKKLDQKKKHKDALKAKKLRFLADSELADRITEDVDQAVEGSVEGLVADIGDVEDDEEEFNRVNLDAIDESDSSDSSIELEKRLDPRSSVRSALKHSGTSGSPSIGKNREHDDVEEEEGEENEEEDIPVSDLEDLEDEDKEDLIPHTRLTINNTTALLASLSRISIPTDASVTFSAHHSVLSTTETALSIPDISDDLQRELSFYAQSLEAVRIARSKLRAEKAPFSRPKDYFAEMVKEDAHMEKVKAKLVEEASAKKASAEARKLRDLKKFGKQVQVAKLQERQKEKRDTLDKIKSLKRKRQESNMESTTEADLFDVGVESELASHKNSRAGSGRDSIRASKDGSKVNHKRNRKNEKFGFGGKKRHSKSGDAMSSGDLSGFNAKRMKAGGKVSQRPGKARRKANATR